MKSLDPWRCQKGMSLKRNNYWAEILVKRNQKFRLLRDCPSNNALGIIRGPGKGLLTPTQCKTQSSRVPRVRKQESSRKAHTQFHSSNSAFILQTGSGANKHEMKEPWGPGPGCCPAKWWTWGATAGLLPHSRRPSKPWFWSELAGISQRNQFCQWKHGNHRIAYDTRWHCNQMIYIDSDG